MRHRESATRDLGEIGERSPPEHPSPHLTEAELAPLSGVPPASQALEPVFAPDRGLPAPTVVRIGALDPLSQGAPEALAADARAALTEAIALRLDALTALRAVDLPEARLDAMADTAALAERQFRQGAIPLAPYLAS